MEKVLEYKGFIGSIEFSLDDNVLYGKLLYINGLVTYEGRDLEELRQEFQLAVDDYLELCQTQNIQPLKSFNGKFNVRISPDLHQKVAFIAAKQGVALNAVISQAIENEVRHSARL
ncbi:type II toxin-antitoxin system HicB family antitoxin [Lonepinella koalarum]|uniref:Putative HicB family RNase H-like nuclease n=1 Tax=Lonepinella koalarum TaxID=53417 RepID=A0A4R1L2A7_9PAST|nr:type II toxin-antitoxin system HicB family antitoxin [Lonepinella koalarum]MDH2926046.1 hypothetical protein [Lonepinella koalarum]TCK71197.1 putative HicB family RNase H-like nuclease [Lonepinella koalarum]TFJ90923.1 type II toxin-antitoxin system HicB family antitoxin [Lonepinella koalarum]